jgi:RNA polymerase sigma-70 factor (ECF subfamily)
VVARIPILAGLVNAQPQDPDYEALVARDDAAFAALVARMHGPLMRLATGYVRERAVAEDVVQETWLTCLDRLDSFEGRSSFKTWVYGIALNIARARRRRERRWLPFTSWGRDASDSRRPTVDPRRFGPDRMWLQLPDPWSNVPEAQLLSAETLGRVREAIDSLPEKQREVITLRDVAGLGAAEVARMLGISAENERVRLHRARAAVRGMLEEYLR